MSEKIILVDDNDIPLSFKEMSEEEQLKYSRMADLHYAQQLGEEVASKLDKNDLDDLASIAYDDETMNSFLQGFLWMINVKITKGLQG